VSGGSLEAACEASLGGSGSDGAGLTAVKPPELTAVKPEGVEVVGGLAAPFSSLLDRGLSCCLGGSTPLAGDGER
jgi:hypothetical protein